MKLEQDLVIFDHLQRPDPEVVGKVRPVKAQKPESFQADNAPGDFSMIDLQKCADRGKAAGQRLQNLFA